MAAVAALALRNKRCIGLSGGQGAGKSTLAALIARAAALAGRTAVVCSLDDFCLAKDARLQLARTIHPLLATRGPPGTHDLRLALAVLDGVLAGRSTRLPRFDKGRDEPGPTAQWPVAESVDVLIFEGWCLGVEPQPEAMLRLPVNRLEAEEDRDGRWRAYVNAACADYARLWQRVDWWIYIEVPDMNAVRRWRAAQERSLAPHRRMSLAQLHRFIAHYERLTRWQQSNFAPRADWRLRLDADHRLIGP
ncbi:MAG: kinase [Gammaproteobacteria bacterium]|nr:kinase [Gammaproteobacteria bacterium]MCY4343384.1 kinase [Gammaproteobacteria bacterium]